MLHKTHIHDNYLYIIQEMRFDSLGLFFIAFLSSVYLGRYRCMNMGNLSMFKERKTPSLSD